MTMCINLWVVLWYSFALQLSHVLSEYQWKNRVIILQADTGHAKLNEQLRLFDNQRANLEERDLIIFKLFEAYGYDPEQNKLDPGDFRYLLNSYGSTDKTFRISLIGKDGGLKFTANDITKPEQLFALIDRMPMRQQEMKTKQ